MFKKTTLKNGLRILTMPQKNTEAVTALILVGTGSKYEKKETSGISHFLEHLLFKGTEKRPSQMAISEPLDRVGGVYNAFTGEEYTGFYAKVKSENFELALDVLSDIFLNSKIDQKEMEKEKGVIIEEINMHQDHPMSYVQILWSRLLYGDQPAGWDIAGTKETVSKITREDILRYMKSQYVAPNTLVCIAGKTPHSQKKTIKLAEGFFNKISGEGFLKKPAVLEKQNEPDCLLQRKETDQTHLCFGARGYHLFHKDKYAQEILAVILGGMMSSRLFAKIREELGLAYYISTGSSSCTDTGYLMTQAGVDNSKVEKAVSAIAQEYKRITEEKVPKEELEKAKENIKGKMALLLETSDAWASFYGLQEILENKILTSKEIFKQIDAVSENDILRVARDIFKPKNLNLALIGPFSDKAKFQKLLTI